MSEAALRERQDWAARWLDEQTARFSAFNARIWGLAEPAWREYRSAASYCELLRQEGFAVEAGSGDMPTSFAAQWGSGGPVLGSFAEYDAVPGHSQQVEPRRVPRPGLHPYAAGHTDPHSSLGTAALAGVLAAKAAMQRFCLPGTLKLFGEPAEKVCGSKPVHAAKGYFDGADAFVVYHPYATNTVAGETQCGSYWSAVFSFEAVAPERWIDKTLLPPGSMSHATARCPGAIDALCLMYTTTKYTKEAMFPHTGNWTLNEFVMGAGEATSDNLPPRFSQIQYSWRSPVLGIQEQIFRVLANNARHAAGATGCEARVRWVTRTRVGLPNRVMTELAYRSMERVGPPRFPEAAREFGRAVQRELGLPEAANPFIDANEALETPAAHEAALRRALPEWQKNFTSDDYVEYTWHAPTVRLFTARPILRPPEPGYEYPAWAYDAVGGLPAAIDPGMMVAAKTIALSLIELLSVPATLEAAQAEFRERTGGGVGGDRWVAPLLPRDFAPPVDLPWPEYVQTVRGEEWCLPTPRSQGEAL
ncbi:MAG TPA: amidohydrolase [Acetobacteraceae bacterium]|nr:amidohydrolase [Acetobacteraceae bacterium]